MKRQLEKTNILFIVIDNYPLLKFIIGFIFLIAYLLKPSIGLAFDTSDPSVSLLQNRISSNFSKKYCNAIQNGFSKDEAMKSAIVKTENLSLIHI